MSAVRRVPVSMVVAVLLAVAGAAGLVRGAMPSSPAAADTAAAPEQPIVATGGFIREPANGVSAAAYFTLYNTTGAADQLIGADSGAGERTTLQTESRGGMKQVSEMNIPAHGSIQLAPGYGHVMIEKLYGPLEVGQSVNLRLTFAKAGQVLMTVPVIAIGAPAPTVEPPR